MLLYIIGKVLSKGERNFLQEKKSCGILITYTKIWQRGDEMHFGEKFKMLIDSHDETYEEIAAALGLKSKSSINHYIKSAAAPKYATLIKICQHFGVGINYFDETKAEAFRQPNREYFADEIKIPVYESEKKNAEKLFDMVLPHVGQTDCFAVIIKDGRLARMNIPEGSTVVLSKEIILKEKNRVVVADGEDRYFATYEKVGDKYTVITPADQDRMPLVIEDGKKMTEKVFAVVKSVIINE